MDRLENVTTPELVSRRTALLGVAGLGGVAGSALAGCTSGGAEPGPVAPTTTGTPPAGRTVEPDVRLAATVLGVERAMLARVLVTQRRHPRLAGPLAAARAVHQAHVDLLVTAVPKGTGSPGPSDGRRPTVPTSPVAALSALARAEDRLAETGRRSALAAESGAFARVLASMAAAAAQQAVHVAGAAEERR